MIANRSLAFFIKEMAPPGSELFAYGPEEVQVTIIDVLSSCQRQMAVNPKSKSDSFLRKAAAKFGRSVSAMYITVNGKHVENGQLMAVYLRISSYFHLHGRVSGA